MIHFDLAAKAERLAAVEAALLDPDIWQNQAKSTELMRRQKSLKRIIDKYQDMVDQAEELTMICDLALEEGDDSMAADLSEGLAKLTQRVEKMSIAALFKGEYDAENAILSVHAGSGGLDAMDWADMLYRMYLRWAEPNDYQLQVLDYNYDPIGGLKGATVRVVGDNAYGYLKSEKGVHRLVRISPFDSSGRRHTSFAAVDVIPELSDEIDIEINPEDLKIDTYRSSGAGGQHVNTTDSAVRITHLPTSIVVQCQNERSQIQNREVAMKMLLAKLIDLKEREHKERIEDIQGDYSEISWGSQIRSYVFQPYQLVKDHRTGFENGNVSAVMDGDLEAFMVAYLNEQPTV